MLKHPDSNVDFVITPAIVLGDFDIYDREETLGAELDKYNPNDAGDLKSLFDRYFFERRSVRAWSIEHKAEVIRVLVESLKNENFDFFALITMDREPDDCFTLPNSWDIENPRLFFLEIYEILLDKWGCELANIGATVEHLK